MKARDRVEELMLRDLKRLWNRYRRNFKNGESEEAFLLWAENTLDEMRTYSVDGVDEVDEEAE